MKAKLITAACSILMTGALLSAPDPVFSQEKTKVVQNSNWDIGAIGGGNFSLLFLGSKEINKDYNFGRGYTAGLTASYKFYKYLSVVGEAYFADMSSESRGIQPLMPSSPLQNTSYQRYANYNKTERFNYIEVPVMVRITTGNKIKYYANIGPYIGFALDARVETSGSSLLYLDREGNYTEPMNGTFHSIDQAYNNTNNTNTLNFGIAAGVGTGYTIGRHGIWLDGRYNMGLTDIRSNTSVNGQNNLQTIMVRLGYTYSIPR